MYSFDHLKKYTQRIGADIAICPNSRSESLRLPLSYYRKTKHFNIFSAQWNQPDFFANDFINCCDEVLMCRWWMKW